MITSQDIPGVPPVFARTLHEKFNELMQISNDKRKAAAILQDINDVLETIFEKLRQKDTSYANLSAIDAIVLHLTKVGHPLSREEIKDSLAKGSFGSGDRSKDDTNIDRSLKQSLPGGRWADQEKIKEEYGLIGLHGWPKKMFEPSHDSRPSR